MTKFKIGCSFGYVGTESYDIINAETLEIAEQRAWERALAKVDSWAEVGEEGSEND
jgi:hypothetical protein